MAVEGRLQAVIVDFSHTASPLIRLIALQRIPYLVGPSLCHLASLDSSVQTVGAHVSYQTRRHLDVGLGQAGRLQTSDSLYVAGRSRSDVV